MKHLICLFCFFYISACVQAQVLSFFDSIPNNHAYTYVVDIETAKPNDSLQVRPRDSTSVLHPGITPGVRSNMAIVNTLTGMDYWNPGVVEASGQNFAQKHYNLLYPMPMGGSIFSSGAINLGNKSSAETLFLAEENFSTDSSQVLMIFYDKLIHYSSSGTSYQYKAFPFFIFHIRNINTGAVKTTLCNFSHFSSWLSVADKNLIESFDINNLPQNSGNTEYYDMYNGLNIAFKAPALRWDEAVQRYVIWVVSDSDNDWGPHANAQNRPKQFALKIDPAIKSAKVYMLDTALHTSTSTTEYLHIDQSQQYFSGNKSIALVVGRESVSVPGYPSSPIGMLRAHVFDHVADTLSNSYQNLLSPGTQIFDYIVNRPIEPATINNAIWIGPNGTCDNLGNPVHNILVTYKDNFSDTIQDRIVNICISIDTQTMQIFQHNGTPMNPGFVSLYNRPFGLGTYGMHVSDRHVYISGANPDPTSIDGNHFGWRDEIKDSLGNSLIFCQFDPCDPMILGEKFQGYTVTLNEIKRMVDNIWDLTEEDVESYTVQKSLNGVLFEDLANVGAKGNGIQFYLYTDESPYCGLNYYQVRMNRLDGSILYTELKSVEVECSDKSIQVFPNPVESNGSFTIRLSENTAQAQFSVYSVIGQELIFEGQMVGQTTVSLQGYPSGVYFVRVGIEGSITKTEKIVLQ